MIYVCRIHTAGDLYLTDCTFFLPLSALHKRKILNSPIASRHSLFRTSGDLLHLFPSFLFANTRMATDNSASPLLPGPTADDDRMSERGAVFSHQNKSDYGTISPPAAFSGCRTNKFPQKFRILQEFIYENHGLLIFALGQFFGSMMSLFTRFLATSLPSGRKYHPLHILFVQMSVTWIFCWVWMWWNRIPDMPFGKKGIRMLLVLRGCMGFFGALGLYCMSSALPFNLRLCCKHRGLWILIVVGQQTLCRIYHSPMQQSSPSSYLQSCPSSAQ